MKRGNRPRNEQAGPDAHGILGWLEETRVSLPLKGVQCRFDTRGDVADVELDQIYFQSASRPLDCTYSFPLPAGAAVYLCEIHINERVIRAQVEESGKARRIYHKRKLEGRRAALVEMERENLFTLSLGNIQAGDLVVVRLAYFQTQERLGDQLSIRIPVCPGVRYIPGQSLLRDLSGGGTQDDTDQVPDASRISPPRMEAFHPDAAYFDLKGTIDGSCADLSTISSASHPVLVTPRQGEVAVAIADCGAVPDRDFVLRWEEPAEAVLTPRAWKHSGGDGHALVQLRAPAMEDASTGLEQDFYFLIDRSGSMKGLKWRKTCDALRAFVDLLGNGDRVWMTFFESAYRDFSDKPMPAQEVASQRAFHGIAAIGTAGGTEMLPAIEHVTGAIEKHSRGRKSVLLIITDAQVGNESAVLEALRPHPGLTVHVVGIDTAVNDALLQAIAKQQHGQCFLLTPQEDVSGIISRLGRKIRRPVFTGIRVEAGWELASGSIPDLYSGEVADIPLKATGESFPIRIMGSLPDGTTKQFQFEAITVPNPAIKLIWAKARIDALIASDRAAEAIALAIENNILCAGTCFVAWDGAEIVPVAMDEIYQPSLVGGYLHSAGMLREQACFTVIRDRRRFSSGFRDISIDSVAEVPPLFLTLMRITARYSKWPESVSMILADQIQDQLTEIMPLLDIERELSQALLAFLGHWATSGPDTARARVAALRELADSLERHPGKAGTARQLMIDFLGRCEDSREIIEACTDSWALKAGE